MHTDFDVIIVGAGHNGLVCACYLASAGCNVAIFERRPIVGGAVVTEEFHPGFRNSTASYTVGLLDPSIIEDLHLRRHGLEIVPRTMANFFPLEACESLSIYNDDELDSSEIARFSQHDAEALLNFRSMLRNVGEVVRGYLHETPPNLGRGVRGWLGLAKAALNVMRLESSRQQQLIDLFTVPITDLLDRWFEDSHVKAAFTFDAVVGQHGSLHSPGSAYGLLHHALGEVASQHGVWGHPIGGMGAITQAMLREARNLGVHVETASEVTKVLVKQGKVDGVQLADGSLQNANIVVANCAPQHLYLDLLSDSDIGLELRSRMKHTRAESAVIRINVALSELPQFTNKPSNKTDDHLSAGIVIGPTIEYMEQAYLDARVGKWSGSPVVEMFIPSTVDSTLTPKNQHVASLFCQHFPFERDWDKHRDAAADTVFQTIDCYAPNFSDAVVAREVLTPLDLERRFGLPRGDIFHSAHVPSQLWLNRPVFGLSAYRGAVSGLFHCGAGSHPGGGVSGIPGRNAAREILRRM